MDEYLPIGEYQTKEVNKYSTFTSPDRDRGDSFPQTERIHPIATQTP